MKRDPTIVEGAHWHRAHRRVVAALAVALAGASFLPWATTEVGAVEEPPPPTVAVPTPDGPPVDIGDVTIVTPDFRSMNNGGSSSAFTLQLPDGASCPGDTASKNWMVQSFLIPVGDDPGTIKYGVIGPEGTQFPLYALDTRPVAHQLTQVSSKPDDPGVIATMPAMSFAVFEPGYIPPGPYTIGVACTLFRKTAHYWDASIIIEADPADQPGQLTWRRPDAATYEPPDDGSVGRTLTIGGIVAALVAAAVLLWQSRRGQRLQPINTSPINTSPINTAKDPR